MSVIVREVDSYSLSQEQLRVLLMYAEQDIHDSSRQAVAFTLVKAILTRRLTSPELHPLMEKVAGLAITSEMEHVRAQARQTTLQYVMDYPLGAKLESLITFFIGQMSYSLESGRQSAIEMLFGFVNAFPKKELHGLSELLFVSFGARLLNEESAECKKLLMGAIKGMLAKVDKKKRDGLFDMILIWMKQKKVSVFFVKFKRW